MTHDAQTPARYHTSLLLFHRNLRLHDNRCLVAALRQSRQVIPCVILDTTLLSRLGMDWPRVRFYLQALRELDEDLRARGSRLHVVRDDPASGINRLLVASQAQAVFVHQEAAPYGRRRNEVLARVCATRQAQWLATEDLTLHPVDQTCKADGTPYTVFTPFFRKAGLLPVPRPARLVTPALAKLPDAALDLDRVLAQAELSGIQRESPRSQLRAALRRLPDLTRYATTRDLPALPGTSRLSASLRFGLLSPREAWWAIASALGETHTLLRQLYWRDFFYSIAHYFPHVFTGCFHRQYDQLAWDNRPAHLAAWQQARTGFPIVDAGMRELHETGYMHNRVRMITASFLVKDLHCDWKLGERHFARHLVDYDPCLNNGNWQWAASTGCDAQPYFRIFNPWLQQQKFDPDCTYIRQWLPALRDVPTRTLHHLFKHPGLNLPGYHQPIVEHERQAPLAKARFASLGK